MLLELTGLFDDRKAVLAVGSALFPGQTGEALGSRLLRGPRWDNAPTEAARRLLSEQIDEDFEHDRVIPVEGLLLSESEVLLYAIVARLSPAHEFSRSFDCNARWEFGG